MNKLLNKLLSFLKSEYRVFITLLFVCFIFGGVFLFAGLNMEYFILGLEITVFSHFSYYGMAFLCKKRGYGKKNRGA